MTARKSSLRLERYSLVAPLLRWAQRRQPRPPRGEKGPSPNKAGRPFPKKRLMAIGTLAVLLLAIWLVGDALIVPHSPVVQGKAVDNASALLASGLKAAERAPADGWTSEYYLGQKSDLCYFVRTPGGGAFSSYPYLACGGVFPNQSGQGYAVWVVPFVVTGAGSAGPGRLSGPVRQVVMPIGTKLWRPDTLAGTLTRAPGGGVEASFGEDFALLTLGSKIGLSIFAADALALVVLTLSALVSLLRRKPKRVVAAAPAPDPWAPLGDLVFAAAVQPPRPVLLTAPQQSSPWPSPAPAWAPSPSEPEDQAPEVPAQPAPPAVEANPEVNVLGPVDHSGWSEAPTRRVLLELAAYLATHRLRPVPAERLRTALWPYEPGQADVALARVHENVSRLRRCLGPDHLPEAAGGYQLAESVGSDWSRFCALAEATRAVPDEEALGFLSEALGLVRGQPFADVAAKTYGWAWEELLVPHMEVAITDAAHKLAILYLRDAQADRAAWAARQGLLAVPKEERLLGDLLEAGAAEGQGPLKRAWHLVEETLGPQTDGPLLARYNELRSR